MTKKRKRRKRRADCPVPIFKKVAMLAAEETLAEVYQTLGITESTWLRWKKQLWWHEVQTKQSDFVNLRSKISD